MKTIQKENYFEFLSRRVKTFFLESANLVYVGIAIIGLGIYWFEDGFASTIRIFFFLAFAFSITLFLAEIWSTIILKKIDKNNFITHVSVVTILTIVSFIFFDEIFRYRSFTYGIIFFTPILILNAFEKLEHR